MHPLCNGQEAMPSGCRLENLSRPGRGVLGARRDDEQVWLWKCRTYSQASGLSHTNEAPSLYPPPGRVHHSGMTAFHKPGWPPKDYGTNHPTTWLVYSARRRAHLTSVHVCPCHRHSVQDPDMHSRHDHPLSSALGHRPPSTVRSNISSPFRCR